MTGAMYAAIAGLRTHMQNLNVIGNNVANVNTNGYKASRAVFKTSLYTTLTGGSNGTAVMGGTNPSQIGYGSNVATVDVDMSTGNYTVTGKSTDLMLDGDGFFLVGDKDIADNFDGSAEDVGRLTSLTLTRVGDFEFKADGYFGKNDGNVVYGFLCVGKYTNDDIYITDAQGQQTRNPNVPATAKVGDPIFSDQLVPIRLPRVEPTEGYVVTTPPADGDTESTSVTWTLISAVQGNGDEYTYTWSRVGENGVAVTQTTNGTSPVPPGADADGAVVTKTSSVKIVYPEDQGAAGIVENEELSRGQFEGISVDPVTGLITGTSRDTKEVVTIGCVAVGFVTNPNGVTNQGDNYYKAGPGSGELTIGILGGNAEAMGITHVNSSKNASGDPMADGLRVRTSDTQMLSNGLEMSKTDLAQEIANMILTQRGYQANTRIITVTDSMLEELVNMKR
ncbi:MAG: flagellar hook-basal body complex protein [Clostridiales bacterium]|nr:flagellar hook-basal body complex protein [Clostridiales bacterium]